MNYDNLYEQLPEPHQDTSDYDYDLLYDVNQNLETVNENLEYIIQELDGGQSAAYLL